jgi:hypothetical protein
MMRHEETSNCTGFCGSKSAVSRDEAFLLGSSLVLVFVLRAHFSCVLFFFLFEFILSIVLSFMISAGLHHTVVLLEKAKSW